MDDVSVKVFVGSIDFNATEKDVEEAFKPFGEIVHVVLIRDKETQKSKGFGFVTFKDRSSVDAAIKGMNKQPILGRPIVVNYAEKKSSGGGGSQSNYNSQQNQSYGYNQQQQQGANPYYQGYPGQQGYGQWNQQGYGAWGQQAYWPQQYGNWGQQAQAWTQMQQGASQASSYPQNNGMNYGNNNANGY